MTGRENRDAWQGWQAHAWQGGMGDRKLGEADVALVVQHPIDDDRRDHAEEGKVEVGALLQEMSCEPRQITIRDRGQCGNPQRADATAADLLGCRGDAFEADE